MKPVFYPRLGRADLPVRLSRAPIRANRWTSKPKQANQQSALPILSVSIAPVHHGRGLGLESGGILAMFRADGISRTSRVCAMVIVLIKNEDWNGWSANYNSSDVSSNHV
jgi:hypothetical protein